MAGREALVTKAVRNSGRPKRVDARADTAPCPIGVIDTRKSARQSPARGATSTVARMSQAIRGWLVMLAAVAMMPQSAHATCDAGRKPVFAEQPTTLHQRFDALLQHDPSEYGRSVIEPWKGLIADLERRQPIDFELLARSHGWLSYALAMNDLSTDMTAEAVKAYAILGKSTRPSALARVEVSTLLAMAETNDGALDAASGHAREAHSLAVQAFGPVSAEVSFADAALGTIAYGQGHFFAAETLYDEATQLAIQCTPPDTPQIVERMTSHSSTLTAVGRHEDAMAEDGRAVAWANAHLSQHNTHAMLALANLGAALGNANRLAEAEAVMRAVVDLKAKNEPEDWFGRAITLSNFASVLDSEGQSEQAETLWLRANDLYAKATSRENPVARATPLRNAANVAQARGEFDLALARRSQAIAAIESYVPAEHPELARARIEYALTMSLQGRPDAALKIAGPAIKIIRASYRSDNTRRIVSEIAYARIVTLAGSAVEGYAEAAAANGAMSDKLMDTSVGRGDLVSLAPLFSTSLAQSTEIALASNHATSAFDLLQLANLTDIVVVSSDVAARAAAANPAIQTQVRALQDHIRLRQGLARERSFAASAGNPKEVARLDALIAANDAQITTQGAEIDRLFPAYRMLGRPAPVSLAAFQARLRPGQILLAPLPIENGTLAIAVTHEGLTWAKTPTTRVQITKLVNRIRNAIEAAQQSAHADPGFDVAAAAELYKAIAPPPIAAILRTHPDLLYYAAGALASVPPALLVSNPSGATSLAQTRWLVRTHAITVLPTLLARTDDRQTRGPSGLHFLGVGAPILGPVAVKPATPGFVLRSGGVDAAMLKALPELPGAQAELRAIGSALGGRNDRLLVADEATEAGLRALPIEQYSVIAFATHGLVGNDFAGLTEPALVMTPPASASASASASAGDEDDGLLTASEIAGLRLNAEWVILSACNSASGNGAGSPTYGGLASAFLQAGARALLVSHWPVRDDAAERITVETVRRTAMGETRAVALQRATLALIADRHIPQSANPAIWAPFVLIDR